VVTVDASVLVAAGARDDLAHTDSLTFLRAVLLTGSPIHQPTLSLVEVSAVIARRTDDAGLAREAGSRLLRMPGLILHPLDTQSAAEAAVLAGRARLRGADAVYAATALRHGTVLVTLDEELLTRTSVIVDAMTPSEWLSAHP